MAHVTLIPIGSFFKTIQFMKIIATHDDSDSDCTMNSNEYFTLPELELSL